MPTRSTDTSPLCRNGPRPPACPTRAEPEPTDLAAMLARMRFSHHDAEDAAQDAALIALRHARAGRAGTVSNPTAWLKKVAVRAAFKAAARRLPCDPDAVHAAAAPAADEAGRRDEGDALRRAVRELPGRLREVVEYCALEGHSHDEAVRRFGVCVGTIGRRLRAARLALLASLRGRGFDPASCD